MIAANSFISTKKISKRKQKKFLKRISRAFYLFAKHSKDYHGRWYS